MDVQEQASELQNLLIQVTGLHWVGTLLTVLISIVVTAVLIHIVVKFLKDLFSRSHSPLGHSTIFLNIFRGVSWAICASAVLSGCFGVNVSAAVTALGVGGIALSLGLQNTISNLIGGLQVSIMHIVSPGDYVQMGTIEGTVRDVTWRHTTLVTPLGDVVAVPNSNINTSSLTHLPSATTARLLVCLTCEASELEKRCEQIEKTACQVAESFGHMEKEPKLQLFEVNEDGFRGRLVYDNTTGASGAEVRDAIIKAIAPYTR